MDRRRRKSYFVFELVLVGALLALAMLVVFPADADELRAWQAAGNTALAVDWLQTRYIAEHDGYRELNPILGDEPSTSDVNLYFAISAVALNVLGEGIAMHNRDWGIVYWQAVTAVEGVAVLRNHAIGVRYEF